MFLKVIACEIAFREICHLAAKSPHLLDLEFLTQGYHDIPGTGRAELQKRIDAIPAGKYDAIILGYGLCSNILAGLRAGQTQLVVPRAHDCITFFLGSRTRYQQMFDSRPGTYYYTSGWLECAKRRGQQGAVWGGASVPASASGTLQPMYQEWVRRFGEDQARYLLDEMSRWSTTYSHGLLISFEFVKHLRLHEHVRQICGEKGWEFEEIEGDLQLLQRILNAEWKPDEALVVQPGQRIMASNDDQIIRAETPAD